ncbi:MAG: DUF1501 domain-containing protein, partial [Phycisphaeraceae bacterium]
LDIYLNRKKHRHCNGATRRDFLRIGALAPIGLALPQLLAAQATQAAEQNREAASGPKARAKSVILVFLGGGLSHHDSFDPKPEAPEEIRGKYGVIPTNVKGLNICEKLPLMAKVMDKVALVRSGAHNNDHHETATNWVLCGRFGTPFGDYPAMGAVVAHQKGFTAGKLPPYVAVPKNPSFTWELGRSAFLGGRYESFKAGNPNDANYKVRDLTLQQPMKDDRIARRDTLLKAVDSLSAKVQGDDQIQTYDEFSKRAAEMILSPEAQSAFDIDKESKDLRDRYGRSEFGQSCLLARRLAQRGVAFTTINYGGWDHHAKIFESLDKKLPELDQGLSALVQDMHDTGAMKETLLVVMGEFGRSPKVNKDAGRDHWGPAASMLFAGAGVKEGFVLGATDKHGGYATERPVSPADVSYTIYESLGINPRKHIHTPDGRPLEILDQGAMVTELFA